MSIVSPRDIPDLLFWGSPEYEAANYTDGQAMTGLTDLSGLGNHATAVGGLPPLFQATTGPGGAESIRFRGTHGTTSATWGYFSLPAGLMGSAASGEITAMLKSDGANCSLWGLGVSAGSSAASHYPFSGTIYEGFGTNNRKTLGAPVLSITDWRRYNVWSAANDYAAQLDSTSQFTSGSNTVLWDAAPIIGHGKRNGAVSDNTGSFQGNAGAILIYGRKLTTTERADRDEWMAANPNGGLPPPPEADPVAVAALHAETLVAPEQVRAASTRLGMLILEYVPIKVGAVGVEAITDSAPHVRLGSSHVEVLIQERVPLRTVPGELVRIKRDDGRWEQPWLHWSDI